MKYFEFGRENEELMVLLHGGGTSYLSVLPKGTVDKKLSANLEELKAKGCPVTCKIFEDMGHGGLIGENTERFIDEVDAVHLQSKKKTGKRV